MKTTGTWLATMMFAVLAAAPVAADTQADALETARAKKLEMTFMHLDIDRDRKLTAAESRHSEFLTRTFRQIDLNGNGWVDQEEFSSTARQLITLLQALDDAQATEKHNVAMPDILQSFTSLKELEKVKAALETLQALARVRLRELGRRTEFPTHPRRLDRLDSFALRRSRWQPGCASCQRARERRARAAPAARALISAHVALKDLLDKPVEELLLRLA